MMKGNVQQRPTGPADKGTHDIAEHLAQQIKGYVKDGLAKLPANTLVQIADQLGKHLKDTGLKTTQIRRFLDGVRRLDIQFSKGKAFSEDHVVLLKPKLAYAAGRSKEVRPLMEVLQPAITAGSKSYADFKRLLSLIEAIVAYHKYYGGAD